MYLLLIALLYFFLSFIMQRVINRLPLFCSLFWPFIATWGIIWTIVPYAVVQPHLWPQDVGLWPHVIRLAIIFLAALPGQYVAYRNQILTLIAIFREYNITKATTGKTIYFHETQFCKELLNELGQQDSNLSHLNNYSGFNRDSIKVAHRHVKRYRRRYPC